jgi:hypothetical protein
VVDAAEAVEVEDAVVVADVVVEEEEDAVVVVADVEEDAVVEEYFSKIFKNLIINKIVILF